MRWPLSRRRRGGRLPSLGQDFAEAHRRYVERLGTTGDVWLRNKPFSAPPGHELRECLRVFVHIVERLGLGYRAAVLDVGCGPGWLSELLARCGYSVTGVDISEDMVRIARERIAALGEIGPDIEPIAEFHAMPVLELPWTERFEAAILYDAMHHFHDEVETLQVIRRTLVPGGRVFIHEGVRPVPGSEGERQLIAEMAEYGTLESPFDPEYLTDVLEEAGFTDIVRIAAIDELLDVSAADEELQRIELQLRHPPMNTIIAFNPVPAAKRDERRFAGRIETHGSVQLSADGRELLVPVTVTNTGRAFWQVGLGVYVPHGSVTLAPYVVMNGDRVELARQPLPRALAPGESVPVDIRVARDSVAGAEALRIDLVHEGIAWFSDYGSTPLDVPLPEET
jgi:SAM-dependent methyltransferase